MVEIRRVGVVSLALMMGLISGAYGLLIGLIFACFMVVGFAGMAATFEDLTGFGGGILFGALYVICIPILNFVVGFIAGAIAGLLYNFAAGIGGGIKVELSGVETSKEP